jgi:hypothetical protein
MNLLDDGIDQYQGINLGRNRYQSLIDNRPAEAHSSDGLGATSPILEEQKSRRVAKGTTMTKIIRNLRGMVDGYTYTHIGSR